MFQKAPRAELERRLAALRNRPLAEGIPQVVGGLLRRVIPRMPRIIPTRE